MYTEATRPQGIVVVRHTKAFFILLLAASLLAGCVTLPSSPYQPPANPDASDLWRYQLAITPPLPADQVRVDILYEAGKPTCPVSQVGLRINPQQHGQVLAFGVLMDQFKDPRCDWHANQIWIALGKQDDYRARFSLPVGSVPQTRWCRLNPQHGTCLAQEKDVRAFKVPGTVYQVTILRGE